MYPVDLNKLVTGNWHQAGISNGDNDNLFGMGGKSDSQNPIRIRITHMRANIIHNPIKP